MSQEPVTEQFPCEYCQQLCPPKQLHSHEVILTKMTNLFQQQLTVSSYLIEKLCKKSR
jgi:hypothetical protein